MAKAFHNDMKHNARKKQAVAPLCKESIAFSKANTHLIAKI
jgi:hypothetical protein